MQIGHLTDRGRVRELNEDNYLVLAAPNLPPEVTMLLAVADGMGGHQAGEVASGQVVASLNQLFSTGQFRQWVDYNPEHPDYYVAVLKEVLEGINNQLLDMAAQHGLAGMGTTATVVLLKGAQLFVGHVGDSRAYLWRGGTLQQLTHDHSWVAEQVASGALSPAEAYHHPKKNLLLQALGNSSVLRVDRTVHEVYAGDIILLCSDGLTNKVSDVEIGQIMSQQPNPQTACQQLVHLANSRGGEDNITVIVARLDHQATQVNVSGGRAVSSQPPANNSPTPPLRPKNWTDTDEIKRPTYFDNTAVLSTAEVARHQPIPNQPQQLNLTKTAVTFIALVVLYLGTAIAMYELGIGDLIVSLELGLAVGAGFIIGIGFSYWLFPFDG